MTVTKTALDLVDRHWAVVAVGDEKREQAFELAKFRFLDSAVGCQMPIDVRENTVDEGVLERLATAYEIAAIEGINALLHPSSEQENMRLREQTQAGAHRAYDLKRTVSVPPVGEERIFHILHLAALAYCGDRWTDIRRWLKERQEDTAVPPLIDTAWDRRVLFRLFDCWLRLLRKDGWDDLNEVCKIIPDLREEQKHYEQNILTNNQDNESLRATAFRLIALYHWAKATELLAVYMLQGEPAGITTELDQHFESGCQAALAAQDPALEVLLQWLHVAARRMVAGSLWWVAQAVNSRVSEFIKSITKSQAMFELLPPQRVALQEQNLLDQASRAVIVDMPTSGGKTTLAQFRILQALNQFDADHGWVAYVAPTRALVAQLTRRLRRDFNPLGIRVEQLTGAVEIDAFEEALLNTTGEKINSSFDILILTPEKLHLVIRTKKVSRPLALVVMDEAQNIEDEERGLRIELLLATIKQDCPRANYLLLMPYVPNASDLAQWLAPESGKTISLGTSAWQPNERIVGMFNIQRETTIRAGWSLNFETLATSPNTIQLRGKHRVGTVKPLKVPFYKVKGVASTQAAAMAKVFSERGTSIAIAQKIPDAWSMARKITASLDVLPKKSPEIALVQRFLKTEIGDGFELVEMLDKGVAVHHAGLSDETRALIEWLAELGEIRVLCATTTIAQGLNFPVSSVFLASRKYPYGKEMPQRAFWNLAGRVGRINQDSVGIIGLAAGDDVAAIQRYVSNAIGKLVSRLTQLLDDVEKARRLDKLDLIIQEEQWVDFRCYIAHLWREKKNLDAVLAETEQLLRNTFGFGLLQSKFDEVSRRKVKALLKATKSYAHKLAKHPENATLADATGFSPEGVSSAIMGLNQLEQKLNPSDWEPGSLFGAQVSSALPGLIGIMMKIPQLKNSLEGISSKGLSQKRIAEITSAWVTGNSIQQIAEQFFADAKSPTESITNTCKAIYKTLVNSGPWGLSALTKMPTSGIDFDNLSESELRKINILPAMIYHGVQTEPAVLMRMNSVPRSIAEPLGNEFAKQTGSAISEQTVTAASNFIRQLKDNDWELALPRGAAMAGADYRQVWQVLSGEEG